jgi:hypothetical protein
LTGDQGNPVELKNPKEIVSDSLQNPSDPDATYSGHKGQGYQVQVMETNDARARTLCGIKPYGTLYFVCQRAKKA